MINSYLMTMAIVWKGGAFFHYCRFPLLLGRDNWFLRGNKVSTMHASQLRRWFDSKEGWKEEKKERRDKLRAGALKANKPYNYLQLKTSLTLAGSRSDTDCFSGLAQAYCRTFGILELYVEFIKRKAYLLTQSVILFTTNGSRNQSGGHFWAHAYPAKEAVHWSLSLCLWICIYSLNLTDCSFPLAHFDVISKANLHDALLNPALNPPKIVSRFYNSTAGT